MNKKKDKKPIYVVQPSLPPLEEYVEYLEGIWDRKILSNNGPLCKELEEKLAKYLGVKYISLFTNGTLALMSALQVLNLKGEVITTPFSFVATTHSLVWNNLEPVFVDIEPDTFNLDPKKIEEAITEKTSAIFPVHVYGNPCDVVALEKIAKKHNLALIYDAAHTFGVEINGNSVLNFGDLSVLSFHATKVFNTIEGGAVICHDEETKKRIDWLKNFGITDEVTVQEIGLNAKMNEFQAAMGLCQLKYVDENIEKRKKVFEKYREGLKNIKGISFLNDIENVKHNYAYFPIFVDEKKYGKTRDEVYEELKEKQIFARRYFYPLITEFKPYCDSKKIKEQEQKFVFAQEISKKVICLPIYASLDIMLVETICLLLAKMSDKGLIRQY